MCQKLMLILFALVLQWMYILPIGLIVLNAISQVANIAEEGAPGQGPPGAAPQRLAPGGAGPRRR